jgi:acetylornithine deacetylase
MLAHLVAFPSVSTTSNLDIIAFCRAWLSSHGVESRIVPSPDGDKANLFATIGPNVEGGIVLSGHTDVVPVDGQAWTSDPWTLTERQGRLYGRGATDMKGFDALVLALVPDMVAAPLRRPVHIALSYDEELACRGAPSLVRAMVEAVPSPAAVIVGEPTRHAVVTGHKASVQLVTRVAGRSVHSSRIDQGVSAVMQAARLIAWHHDVMEDNRRRAYRDSPFEPAYTTLHCGMVEGGTAANIVAASAWFFTDIRAVPTEDPYAYCERYRAYARGRGRHEDHRARGRDRNRGRLRHPRPSARGGGRCRAHHAPDYGRQRHACRRLRYGGGAVPGCGLVDRGVRPGRHRASPPTGRIYRGQRTRGGEAHS